MIERAPTAGGFEDIAGYCRATRAGSVVTVSGTVAIADDDAELTESGTYEQTRNALSTAIASAEELAGRHVEVMHTRCYLAPSADWQEFATAHHELFNDARPANTTLYVAALIPPGALVEIELLAHSSALEY